jgi:hypothetical protein
MPFTIWFEDVRAEPASAVLERLRKAEKKPLGELLVYDLVCAGSRPLLWGVYFFYSPSGECLYVGKNAARKFVERIPVHLCLWEDDWMNHFVKRIQKYERHACLRDSADFARDHTLLLLAISAKAQRGEIAALERFFRLFTYPKYNSLPMKERHKQLNLGAPLGQLLVKL